MNTRYKLNARTAESGFTLVELSIVLVIIGFLIAGIAAATNMVKQAELRSVMSDMRNYATSYNNFVGKYNAVPGDFSSADTVFDAQCGVTSCLGNGNGIIELDDGTIANEVLNAWTQLGAAGFINGSFASSGTASPAVTAVTIGADVPPSKVSGAGYQMVGGDTDLVTGLGFNFSVAQNALLLGKVDTTTPSQLLGVGSLVPEDAYQLDSKMDDGNVNGSEFVGANTGSFMAADGVGAVGTCAVTGGYTISNGAVECIAAFALN